MIKPFARLVVAVAVLALVLTLVAARDAGAGAPTDQLRKSVDQVLKILGDPELKKEAKTAERRAQIRAVANDIFDFPEISRRSLALHWQARTPAERTEFVGLFGDLLENSYISKIESFSGEKIQYGAETLDGSTAIVRTRIVTKQGTEIPVDYRMLAQGEQWRAYDVMIEGVSLVANYRAQFNTIVQRSGYPDLVLKLKAKQDERPGARATAARGTETGRAAGGGPAPSPRQSP